MGIKDRTFKWVYLYEITKQVSSQHYFTQPAEIKWVEFNKAYINHTYLIIWQMDNSSQLTVNQLLGSLNIGYISNTWSISYQSVLCWTLSCAPISVTVRCCEKKRFSKKWRYSVQLNVWYCFHPFLFWSRKDRIFCNSANIRPIITPPPRTCGHACRKTNNVRFFLISNIGQSTPLKWNMQRVVLESPMLHLRLFIMK